MSARANVRSPEKSLADYAVLRKKVEETLIGGQLRLERQRVRIYWETGRMIHQHILHHNARAGYDQEIIVRLSEDVSVDKTVLWRMLRFFESFPIVASWQKNRRGQTPLMGTGR